MNKDDVVTCANMITRKIAALETERNKLSGQADNKARAIAEHEKNIAITMIRLRSGQAYTLDGNDVKDPPGGLIEKIARGICWESCYEKERQDGLYKALITSINAIEAQLNGYQSINRYLKDAI